MPSYRKLIEKLAELYPSKEDIHTTLDFAEIPRAGIREGSSSLSYWNYIIQYIEPRGQLNRLLQYVVDSTKDKQLLAYVKEETTIQPYQDVSKTYQEEFIIDKKQLQDLLRQDKLKEVLGRLDLIAQDHELTGDYHNSIILAIGRLNSLKREWGGGLGTLRRDDYQFERRKMAHSINYLIDEIDSEKEIKNILRGISETKPEATNEIGLNVPSKSEFEKRINKKSDIEPIEWLHEAILKSRFVCKVDLPMGTGTGFLLPGNYLLTNHHVICKHFPQHLTACDSACKTIGSYNCLNNAKVIFGYQAKAENTVIYDLAPTDTYIINKDLDYALIKIKDKDDNPLSQWGYATFDMENIPKTGEFVSIIQHPQGQLKKIAMPDLVLNAREELNYLYYKPNTLRGSSGSPVFNQKWDVVALHHAGLDDEEGGMEVEEGKSKVPANRGILIGAILKDLKSKGIHI